MDERNRHLEKTKCPKSMCIDTEIYRIKDSCNSETPSILRNIYGELLSRIQMCVVSNGKIFERIEYKIFITMRQFALFM